MISLGICNNCGFKVKLGEWYATRNLHFYCATPKDLRILKEEGQKRFEESLKNKNERKGGTHFGASYDGFCLEY